MKKLLLFMVSILFFVVIAEAQVPRYFTLQGRLLNKTTGMPESGTKQFNFTLYNALTGGSLVWGPQLQSVTVANDGSFTTTVGPFPDTLFGSKSAG